MGISKEIVNNGVAPKIIGNSVAIVIWYHGKIITIRYWSRGFNVINLKKNRKKTSISIPEVLLNLGS